MKSSRRTSRNSRLLRQVKWTIAGEPNKKRTMKHQFSTKLPSVPQRSADRKSESGKKNFEPSKKPKSRKREKQRKRRTRIKDLRQPSSRRTVALI